ncbi:MAG: LysM peptidoglycan-binding domain-containing protein [Planctomycetota bacterium]
MATNLLKLTSRAATGDNKGGFGRKPGGKVPDTVVANRNGKGGFPALNPAARLALIFAVPAVMLAALALPALLGSSTPTANEATPVAAQMTFDDAAPATPTPMVDAGAGNASTLNVPASTDTGTGSAASSSSTSNAATPSAVPNGRTTYTVQTGDRLEVIARKVYGKEHSLKWKDIAKANGITDPSRLQVGQELIIPQVDGVTPVAANPSSPSPAGSSAGSPVPTPAQPLIGNLGGGSTAPVDPAAAVETERVSKLVVPETTHQLQAGDNPYRLATRYYNDVSEHGRIRAANENVDWMHITPGQTIRIPALTREVDEPVSGSGGVTGFSGFTAPRPTIGGDYTVKPGDTLSKISREQFGDERHVPAIKALNGLSSDAIFVGQVLRLPTR